MSSKEALQTLQTRLAERLQTVSDGKIAPYWLAVKVGAYGLLLPLSQSGEIYPWIEPHHVPYAKNWFLGVANLRGSLCGVASLAKYMDIDRFAQAQDSTKDSASSYLQDRRLVAFHPAFEINTVLAVDQLAGLKSKDQMTPTDTQDIYLDRDQEKWQQIDLSLLAKNPDFISIQAH